jgi:hypothetical protein
MALTCAGAAAARPGCRPGWPATFGQGRPRQLDPARLDGVDLAFVEAQALGTEGEGQAAVDHGRHLDLVGQGRGGDQFAQVQVLDDDDAADRLVQGQRHVDRFDRDPALGRLERGLGDLQAVRAQLEHRLDGGQRDEGVDLDHLQGLARGGGQGGEAVEVDGAVQGGDEADRAGEVDPVGDQAAPAGRAPIFRILGVPGEHAGEAGRALGVGGEGGQRRQVGGLQPALGEGSFEASISAWPWPVATTWRRRISPSGAPTGVEPWKVPDQTPPDSVRPPSPGWG